MPLYIPQICQRNTQCLLNPYGAELSEPIPSNRPDGANTAIVGITPQRCNVIYMAISLNLKHKLSVAAIVQCIAAQKKDVQ